MYASSSFITHILQSKMTSLLASSFHWLPGEKIAGYHHCTRCRPSIMLAARRTLQQATDISCSEFLRPVQGHTRHSHLHIHWMAQEMPLLTCAKALQQ